MNKPEKMHIENAAVLTAVIILVFLSKMNYLLYHTIAELFSIIVAYSVFILAWNSKVHFKGHFLLLIGISYLFIGTLDLFHALSYKGMNIFSDKSSQPPTALWISARYMEAVTMLISFSFLNKRINTAITFIIYLTVTSLIFFFIFYTNSFPLMFSESGGLTDAKVISEYVICAIIICSLIVLYKNKKHFDPSVFGNIMTAYILTILTELTFTFYTSVYGHFNLLGHIFKILSFYYIYKAIIVTGYRHPYNLIFHQLGIKTKELESLNSNLEKRVDDEVERRQHQEQLMMQQAKMAAVGEMMTMVTHQWKEPLHALSLVMEEMKNAVDNKIFTEERQYMTLKLLDKVHNNMTDSMETFTGIMHPSKEKKYFSVFTAFEDAIKITEQYIYRYNIKIEKELCEGMENREQCYAFGFPNEFRHVLINLISNAKDAIVERQKNESLDFTPKIKISLKQDGDFAVMTVKDNGIGIKQEIIDQIFKPFMTSKTLEKGSGLGLYMSKIIVEENMNGTIEASSLEQGAQIMIKVPVHYKNQDELNVTIA